MTSFGSRGIARTVALLLAVALGGCGGGGDDGGDACAERGAYANGVCDLDCPAPDPDCDPGGGDPCFSPDRYGDGTCDLDCEYPDPDCGGGGGDPCAAPNPDRYADGTCDLDCSSPDPDCPPPPQGEILLGLPTAAPNPLQAGGGAEVAFGIPVTPSASVTVDWVRVDVAALGGTALDLAEQVAGQWEGAWAVPNTVPSGAYDLTVTARGTDALAGGAEVIATATVHVVIEQLAGLSLDPGESPSPASLLGGVAAEVLFPARVTARWATVDAVTVDLSSLGGAADEPLHDDGTHGDAVAGDGSYATTWSVPETVPNGVYALPVTATGLIDGTLPVTATADLHLLVRGRLYLEDAALLEGSVTWRLGDTIPIFVTEVGVARQVTARARAWAAYGATLSGVTLDLSGLGGDPDAPMYDDGAAAQGGHEPDGEAAADGTFHAVFTVPASLPATEAYVDVRATASDPGGDLSDFLETVVLVHDAGYAVTAETNVPLQTIVGTGTLLPMSSGRGVYGFPDGYEFPFYGVPYGAITVYSSGFVRLGSVLAYTQPYEGDARSYALLGLAPMIAICQSHDLSTTAYQVWVKEQGTAPNRRFVVEWVATLLNTGSIDAQLILDESGSLTIHYGVMDDTAAASLYYSRWAQLLVNGVTEFDQVYGWAEAPPLDASMSHRRWIFTPR